MEIHISWDGPYSFEEIKQLNNKKGDFGVYQIYGNHPIYGSKVLLYIGKVSYHQTFANRLSLEKKNWEEDENFESLEIYVGKLYGSQTPEYKEWSKQIDMAEKLLICSHSPAYNFSRKGPLKDPDLQDVFIYNWDEFKSLLPEVSGARWTNKFLNNKMIEFGTDTS
jgi:hypothetical protein